eukprot:scaffold4212_cov132-Ochromonas_danica.AAC.1
MMKANGIVSFEEQLYIQADFSSNYCRDIVEEDVVIDLTRCSLVEQSKTVSDSTKLVDQLMNLPRLQVLFNCNTITIRNNSSMLSLSLPLPCA